jgi:hypothetical protein
VVHLVRRRGARCRGFCSCAIATAGPGGLPWRPQP